MLCLLSIVLSFVLLNTVIFDLISWIFLLFSLWLWYVGECGIALSKFCSRTLSKLIITLLLWMLLLAYLMLSLVLFSDSDCCLMPNNFIVHCNVFVLVNRRQWSHTCNWAFNETEKWKKVTHPCSVAVPAILGGGDEKLCRKLVWGGCKVKNKKEERKKVIVNALPTKC